MKFSIGVIGPPDLVDKTLQFAESFPQYRFLKLRYEDENDTVPLFEKNRGQMDVCLFTGNWPYFKVMNHYGGRDSGIPLVYVCDTSLGIYQALAKMLHDGVDTRRLSIDTATPGEARQCLSDVGLSPDALYFLPVESPMEKSEFVSFHRTLWEEGKTSAAATFLRSAYVELSGCGMPVYRCTPSLGGLKEGLVRAVLELEALKAKASQLVVGLVSTGRVPDPVSPPDDPDGRREEGEEHRASRHRELANGQNSRAKLLKMLLEWAGPLGVSVIPQEGGRFSVFMTRGVLDEVTHGQTAFETAPRISKACGLPVFFGFGVAPTASLSFANATLAINYAIETSQSCAFAVFEDSRVVGPLGPAAESAPSHPLEFTTSTTDPSLVSMSSQSGLSVATISRVQAALRTNGSLFITTEQLATYLSISKRNARRILARLEETGLARVAGLNQAGTRGRPQKIYRVSLS
ncbi:MAG: hypothetical protein ACOX5Q_05415 [Bacillota bacterium]|jgi:hypothetical protein|nr:hypothetical protein [Candidatus Fermentithermobacillaceae bacterium]